MTKATAYAVGEMAVRRVTEIVNGAFDDLFVLDSPDATELIMVRHGEPAADGALSELGRCQAMRLATRLWDDEIHAVHASPGRVCAETAELIALPRDLPLLALPDLREIDITAPAETDGSSDLRAEMTLRFLEQPRWDALPGFERTNAFRRRVVLALEAIVAGNPGKRLVIVTHQEAINAYLSMVLSIERNMFFVPDYGSISRLRVLRDLYAVRSLNDSAHLTNSHDDDVGRGLQTSAGSRAAEAVSR